MGAISWKLRTEAPWKDILFEFFPWKTTYSLFNRWASKSCEGVFLSYEAKLIQNGYTPTQGLPGLTKHASEARRGEDRAIERSRGRLTTKLQIAADAHGYPIDFEITGSEVHDATIEKK